MRKAIVTAGVSYHHALTQPGQPLSSFEILDVGALPSHELAAFGLVLVPRSVNCEALWMRRHQFARYLDSGGVLVAFGEAWTDWFPGCRWERESAADLLRPVISPHPLLEGITPEALHWHGKGPDWCNHGHFVPPSVAEVVVANSDGDAWLYVDRVSTKGVIVAATNLDLDTHAFHGNAVARGLLDRLLMWAESEAKPDRSGRSDKIAFLYSGVHFQRGFSQDAEFGPKLEVLPVDELSGADLSRHSALWVPRESNQTTLVRCRDRLLDYLARGGTLVTFEEMNQPWLPELTWLQSHVDPTALSLTAHPLLSGLALEDVRWHGHGGFVPPSEATPLISDSIGGLALLYLDEHTFAPGRLLAGTLDPDCHVGYGSDIPRALLGNLFAWALAPQRTLVGVV
ncbi:MAG: hypothetical protein LC797_24295 [Chloroflexi bacterium]|nr:hypothetical protein [Chloroflexota bacterium]